jgi:hypothetical protein
MFRNRKESTMSVPGIEGIARELGAVSTRRSVLRLLGGAAAMGAVAVVGTGERAEAKRKRGKKKGKGKGTGQQQDVCQPGKQFGAVSVPGTGATVTTPVLVAGQRYRLRASGFWSTNATRGLDAFADFAFADPTTPVTIFQGVRLGLSVDGGSIDQWGSYTTGHVYEREVVGQGAALSLRCSDVVHTDNSGSVLVEILCA